MFPRPKDPEALALAHKKMGYRAAYCPKIPLTDTARIRAMGEDLTLWLNGTRTGNCTDNTLAKGRIGIQIHPGNGFKGMQMIVKKMEIRTLTK